MEYEKLAKVSIDGRVIDVGGGKKSLYRDLLPVNLDYESLNIDPSIEPTYLIGPGERFPISDGVYDTCLCLNTLEHIYDARLVLDEILRVLKPGGVAYITVPWIFRVHGHPDDYFRGTPSWWRETLSRVGFTSTDLQPLVWGRATAGGSISGYRLLKRFRFHLAHLSDIFYAAVSRAGKDGVYAGRRGERICDVAPGFFITVRKQA
jgi:SAM-dependent methyltransferase